MVKPPNWTDRMLLFIHIIPDFGVIESVSNIIHTPSSRQRRSQNAPLQ